MAQNNGIKVCPTCFYKNAGDARSCVNCKKRLSVGVVAQPASPPKIEPPPMPPDQKPTRQTPSDFSDPFPKQRLEPKKSPLVLIVLALALITASFLVFIALKIKNGPVPVVITPTATHVPTTTQAPSDTIGEVTNATGHFIGINDGSFAPFDIGRRDLALKQQADEALKEGNSSAAVSLWQQALAVENNDPEALIYIEDQRVLASGEPYITLVAGVAFTPPFPDGSSESDLQGVYVAQHEFNTNNHSFQVRVLIANSGDHATDTTTIAQQIVHLTQKDPTVVGVIGWRYSSYSLLAIPVLAAKKIPLISPQSTSDALTGISHYFFRVVAPNKEEAQTATPFAEKTLGFKHPVIFFDSQDTYSQSLAQGFIDQFSKDGYNNIYEEKFTTNDKNPKEKFAALIQDAEKHNPDGFIFTGRSNDDTGFFQDALPTSGRWAALQVIAGSASYTAHPHSRDRWYFIAAAYHGAENTPLAKKFQQEYSADFNAHNQKPAGYYGYTLADDHATVAYDATALTLKAILNTGKTNPTPQDLARELPNIKGTKAFQGVSGQISFGSDGNPINKTLVILFVPLSGGIQLVSVCSINAGCHK
jgi:ABC-type branched-subunit amino acid transport system substrate-binding protein